MNVIRPDWSAPAHVKVVSTTREGGVSRAPYDSLNLGLHVNDDAKSVHENRRRIITTAGLPAEPLWLRQVHGKHLLAADQAVEDPTADGAWLESHGHTAVVLTADCLPVAITDTAGSRVAVVHAGWRGLAAGVLVEAVKLFAPGASLHAWLGPAIGPKAFEVGEEVRTAFVQRDAHFARAFTARDSVGKYLADLYALARIEMSRDADIEFSGGQWCTYTDAARFHSHRRDGVASGRMGTFAWLERA